ncbi:hypothetical protein MRX96_007457 [Rhipicephalus microplus]
MSECHQNSDGEVSESHRKPAVVKCIAEKRTSRGVKLLKTTPQVEVRSCRKVSAVAINLSGGCDKRRARSGGAHLGHPSALAT